MIKASDDLILKHLDKLCNGIGIRLAGARGEKIAADYLAETLEKTGAKVHIETFPVNARCVHSETLEVKIGGHWNKFGGSLFSNTPGTDGKPIEAPLVFFEAAAEYQRPNLEYLRGKAVVHLGCHIESRDHYRRLVGAHPAFLLMVDTRYPGTQPLADGMFPHYFRTFGGVPTLDVAYMDAWDWSVNRADTARICVKGGMQPAESQNVIAELPGVEEKDVRIEIQDDVLKLSTATKGRKYAKELQLPCSVEESTMESAYKNGVLEIRLRKGGAEEGA